MPIASLIDRMAGSVVGMPVAVPIVVGTVGVTVVPTRMAAVIVRSVMTPRGVVGPMVTPIAMMVRSGVPVAAAPPNQTAHQGACDKGACAVAVASVAAMVTSMMPSATVMPSMTSAMVSASAIYEMQITVWCQIAHADGSRSRCWSGHGDHRPDNQTGTECQSCE
eukprot:s1_g1992.t1